MEAGSFLPEAGLLWLTAKATEEFDKGSEIQEGFQQSF